MMWIGEWRVERPLRTGSHRHEYLAVRGEGRSVLCVYSDPALAEHELAMVALLDCPAVASYVGKDDVDGKVVLVQEYHDDVVSAAERARSVRGVGEKIELAVTILRALQEVHARGVVMNSLSLETAWIQEDGSAQLRDFTAAMRGKEGRTKQAELLLNPLYAAPERTDKVDAPVTRSSDLYAFGVLLYWLLVGEFPFESDDLSRLMSLHVARQPDPVVERDPSLPVNLSRVVEKLLEKDPMDRYQSVEGVLYDLVHCEDEGFEIASRDAAGEFRVSDTIYGREHETRQLQQAVHRAANGEQVLVTISGYSGVGKSTIVTEFQRRREDHRSRLVAGKFQQYKKDIPYFAIIEAFEQLFDLLLLSKQHVLDGFRDRFQAEIGDQGLILTSIFPKLELIVGEQVPVDRLVGEEAENRFNYVFLKLIRIVATADAPLVLFLDDLQWTDLVSLNVLRAVERSDCGFLTVVLSYRSNEVDEHHPFQRFLDDVKAFGTSVCEIKVEDLLLGDVSQLVADSLGRREPRLSQIVFEKTHGNAFFVHQLLKGLADRGLFVWDAASRHWSIDPDEVSAIEVSSNVVAFMQARLRRFAPDVLQLLSVIGAVGHRADLEVLSVVTGRSNEELRATLQMPLEDGLMTVEDDEVCFTHDKIQEACYQLNEGGELPRLHFEIASTLLLHGRSSSLDEIFNLAGHLDKGFEYLRERPEDFVQVYMKAALKSKDISAYNEFLVYVHKAMDLLDESMPEADRFAVYREYHIALYLNSMFEEADAFFEQRLLDDPNVFELRENYFSKVSQDSMRGRYREATEFGMSILGRMGIPLKIDPDFDDLVRELDEVEVLFEQKGITRIADLQHVEHRHVEEMTFISEVILATVPAAFFYNPTVACSLIFTTLKLAAKNGVYEAMAYPLSVASTPFILIRNDYRSGYELAEFAMQIAASNKRSLGNAKHLFVLFCWHWSRPMKDDTVFEIARDAHHLLMQGGDIQMAGYTFYNTITFLWERGEPLDTVLNEARKGLEFNVKTQNIHGIGLVTPHNQVVQTLLSEDSDFVNLGVDGFQEAQFVQENAQNTMGLCFFYVFKTQLAYICGAYEEAYAFSVKARELLHFITGFPSTMSGVFYGALCRCERFEPDDEEWTGVLEDLEQLRSWSDGARENFQHKVLLLEAEIARKNGDVPLAIQCYSEAAAAARQNRFTHETALIYERFSQFWNELNNTELSEYYLKRAYHYYVLWGAQRKQRMLRESHPDLLLEDRRSDLDLMSVIRAQNVLAQETQIDHLLRQMMEILLEFSGAEKAFLILEAEAWVIQAYKSVQGEERILESLELSEDLLSVDLVNYVIRTGQAAQLEQLPGIHARSYVSRFQPKSVLAVPVAISGELIAVIYLEHTRIHDMFTPRRQETITLLSAQIAISLQNAQVYNRLEELVEERTAELAQQNEQLVMARERADRANQAKSEFLANMSHELRTPLNAVTGYSELLSSMVSDPKQRSYLSSIKTAGKNLLTLINDVLDLSRIEAGGMVIQSSAVSLKAICEEIAQIFKPRVAEKGLDLIIDRAEELPELLFLDETRVRQILLNLVGNAVKFTDRGFVRLGVRCAHRPDRSVDVVMSVRDSGIGIPESDQERIFGSFVQRSDQDSVKYGGTGLGLAITRRLVEMMNGSITLRSEPGRGTNFTVELRHVKAASSKEQLVQDEEIDLDAVQFSPAAVLVVDDIDSNRRLLAEILSRLQLEVFTSGNGQEALLMVNEVRPDVILMDLRMPVMDGMEALKRLKDNPATREIPVVALTASSTRREKEYALQHGFDGFLPKPLRLADLVDELSAYLERAPDGREPSASRGTPMKVSWREVSEPEILEGKLSSEVAPLYRSLRRALILADVKRLAAEMDRLGRDHRAEALVHCGREMQLQAEMIDVRALTTSLRTLAEVLGDKADLLEHDDDQ